jgi:hypothetical protein
MSDWIPSQVGLRDHPKTRRAARMLGVRRSELVGCLHFLWWWALEYAPDGDIEDFEAEDLAEAADWPGDPQAFIEALVTCSPKGGPGFLEHLDGRLVIHDWEENQGDQFRARTSAAARKRAQRARERDEGVTECDGVTESRDSVTVPCDLARAKDRPTRPTGQEEHSRAAELHGAVEKVFTHWCQVLGHPQAKLTPDRKGKISSRLREGATVERLMQAVDGCAGSKYHMGDNPQGRRYDSIELIFRNAGKVDEFVEMAASRPGQKRPDPMAREKRIERALEQLRGGAEIAARAMCQEDEWPEVERRLGEAPTLSRAVMPPHPVDALAAGVGRVMRA